MSASSKVNALGYRINYREGTISVSDRLIQEANHDGVGSKAYETLETLRRMGMPFVKCRQTTTARKGLTYSKMLLYISMVENSTEYMVEFNRQREASKTKPSAYHYMVDWFNKTFPNFNDTAEFNAEGRIMVTSPDYLEEPERKTA